MGGVRVMELAKVNHETGDKTRGSHVFGRAMRWLTAVDAGTSCEDAYTWALSMASANSTQPKTDYHLFSVKECKLGECYKVEKTFKIRGLKKEWNFWLEEEQYLFSLCRAGCKTSRLEDSEKCERESEPLKLWLWLLLGLVFGSVALGLVYHFCKDRDDDSDADAGRGAQEEDSE